MNTSTSSRTDGIRLEGVTKTYPGTSRPAVDDVSLHIADGEFMTFLGPSGSGKTTTLSMIAGFTELTSGSVKINGKDISGLKPHKRNLGVVFQQYALFPHLSVRDNIAYPLQQRKVPKAEIARRVDDSLQLVSLTEYADRLPKQLSGGQQQRVALARAVVYEPRALLLDEPLGALDKKLRDTLQRQIARMHKELGMTFIFVTHDQEEALTLSDRVAVYNEGRIEQIGSPTELYNDPSTLFVAEFLGESNVFRGSVSDRGLFENGVLSVQCDRRTAGRLGPHAAVIVRPERIRIADDQARIPSGHLSAPARVIDVRYVGSHYRIGLDYGDAIGSAMQLTGSSLPVPTSGETVFACWTPENHSLVDAPQASSSTDEATPPTVTLSAGGKR